MKLYLKDHIYFLATYNIFMKYFLDCAWCKMWRNISRGNVRSKNTRNYFTPLHYACTVLWRYLNVFKICFIFCNEQCVKNIENCPNLNFLLVFFSLHLMIFCPIWLVETFLIIWWKPTMNSTKEDLEVKLVAMELNHSTISCMAFPCP